MEKENEDMDSIEKQWEEWEKELKKIKIVTKDKTTIKVKNKNLPILF